SDLHPRGFIELTTQRDPALARAILEFVRAIIVDETDVAALSEIAFVLSEGTQVATRGQVEKAEKILRVVKDQLKLLQPNGADKIGDIQEGRAFEKFNTKLLKESDTRPFVMAKSAKNIYISDAMMAAIKKAAGKQGIKVSEMEIYNAVRALYAIAHKGSVITFENGELVLMQDGELQRGTVDWSATFNISVYLLENTLRLDKHDLLLKTDKIKVSDATAEATLSQIFRRVRLISEGEEVMRALLIAGGSAYMDVAKAISRMVQGVNVINLKASTFQSYAAGNILTDPLVAKALATGDALGLTTALERLFNTAQGKSKPMALAEIGQERALKVAAEAAKVSLGLGRGEGILLGTAEPETAKGVFIELLRAFNKDQDPSQEEIINQLEHDMINKGWSLRDTLKAAGQRLVIKHNGKSLFDLIDIIDGSPRQGQEHPENIAKDAHKGRIVIGNESALRALDYKEKVNMVLLDVHAFNLGELLQALGRVGRAGVLGALRLVLAEKAAFVEVLELAEKDYHALRSLKRPHLFKGYGDLENVFDRFLMRQEARNLQRPAPDLTLYEYLELASQYNTLQQKSSSAAFKIGVETITKLLKEPMRSFRKTVVNGSRDAKFLDELDRKLFERKEELSSMGKTSGTGLKDPELIGKEAFRAAAFEAITYWQQIAQKRGVSNRLKQEAMDRTMDILSALSDIDGTFERVRDTVREERAGELRETFANVPEHVAEQPARHVARVVAYLDQSILPSEGAKPKQRPGSDIKTMEAARDQLLLQLKSQGVSESEASATVGQIISRIGDGSLGYFYQVGNTQYLTVEGQTLVAYVNQLAQQFTEDSSAAAVWENFLNNQIPAGRSHLAQENNSLARAFAVVTDLEELGFLNLRGDDDKGRNLVSAQALARGLARFGTDLMGEEGLSATREDLQLAQVSKAAAKELRAVNAGANPSFFGKARSLLPGGNSTQRAWLLHQVGEWWQQRMTQAQERKRAKSERFRERLARLSSLDPEKDKVAYSTAFLGYLFSNPTILFWTTGSMLLQFADNTLVKRGSLKAAVMALRHGNISGAIDLIVTSQHDALLKGPLNSFTLLINRLRELESYPKEALAVHKRLMRHTDTEQLVTIVTSKDPAGEWQKHVKETLGARRLFQLLPHRWASVVKFAIGATVVGVLLYLLSGAVLVKLGVIKTVTAMPILGSSVFAPLQAVGTFIINHLPTFLTGSQVAGPATGGGMVSNLFIPITAMVAFYPTLLSWVKETFSALIAVLPLAAFLKKGLAGNLAQTMAGATQGENPLKQAFKPMWSEWKRWVNVKRWGHADGPSWTDVTAIVVTAVAYGVSTWLKIGGGMYLFLPAFLLVKAIVGDPIANNLAEKQVQSTRQMVMAAIATPVALALTKGVGILLTTTGVGTPLIALAVLVGVVALLHFAWGWVSDGISGITHWRGVNVVSRRLGLFRTQHSYTFLAAEEYVALMEDKERKKGTSRLTENDFKELADRIERRIRKEARRYAGKEWKDNPVLDYAHLTLRERFWNKVAQIQRFGIATRFGVRIEAYHQEKQGERLAKASNQRIKQARRAPVWLRPYVVALHAEHAKDLSDYLKGEKIRPTNDSEKSEGSRNEEGTEVSKSSVKALEATREDLTQEIKELEGKPLRTSEEQKTLKKKQAQRDNLDLQLKALDEQIAFLTTFSERTLEDIRNQYGMDFTTPVSPEALLEKLMAG
ncbi:MAG: hypothetical protein HYZ73_09420, partial [Elusimicrobia bacterium]|nr:hypothetical protein [Elusimicrobiota bacterium]